MQSVSLLLLQALRSSVVSKTPLLVATDREHLPLVATVASTHYHRPHHIELCNSHTVRISTKSE